MIIGTRLGVIAAWFRGRTRDTAIGQTSLALVLDARLLARHDLRRRLRRQSRVAPRRPQVDAGRARPRGSSTGATSRTHLILPTLTLTLGEIGPVRVHHARGRCGRDGRRPRHDGARDRTAAAGRAPPAHRPVRAAPDRHPDRAQLRLRARRCDHGRGAVLVARASASPRSRRSRTRTSRCCRASSW